MTNKKSFMLHVPTELHERTKRIADKEMLSVSAFCRMAVNNYVNDYQDFQDKTDVRAEV